jgi:hypothetical protein
VVREDVVVEEGDAVEVEEVIDNFGCYPRILMRCWNVTDVFSYTSYTLTWSTVQLAKKAIKQRRQLYVVASRETSILW